MVTTSRYVENVTSIQFDQFNTLILLLHGYGEYSERYRTFMDSFFEHQQLFCNNKSVAFYSYDMRGHGYSSGHGKYFWRSSDEHVYDLDRIIRDRVPFILDQVLKSPNAQIVLIAHSIGALNLLSYLDFNKTVVEGNFTGSTMTPKTRITSLERSQITFSGLILTSPCLILRGYSIEEMISSNLNSLFAIERYLVKLIEPLFPSLPVHPSFGVLCSNPTCMKQYKYDKMIYKGPWIASTFVALTEQFKTVLTNMLNVTQSQNITIDRSILVMAGQDDKIFDWQQTKHLLENHFGRVDFRTYDGVKHDLLHEVHNPQILQDTIKYICVN